MQTLVLQVWICNFVICKRYARVLVLMFLFFLLLEAYCLLLIYAQLRVDTRQPTFSCEV